jgi:lipopolysaccharide export system permease protein
MKITATLSRYLARTYLVNMLLLFLALLAVIYLFDTVELLRRATKRHDVPLSLVLQMGLLKLPEVSQLLLPFAILFSAMYTFWQLTRRHELVVVRAAGFSVWQFLAPVVAVALGVGVLQMTVLNPLGTLLLGKFEQLERNYLNHDDSQIAVFKEGLWLRQATEAGSQDSKPGYVILHAARIKQPDWTLHNVTVFFFDQTDAFQRRLDAPSATLQPGRWVFKDAIISGQGRDRSSAPAQEQVLPTRLTIADVEDSFSSPETMSFWRLPGHIRTLEETGFDASRLKVYYQNLLAQPLLFAAMVLLAATVALRPPRLRGAFAMLGTGVFIGFFVFFMSSFLQALGSSQQIPVLLAAWSPALICLLLGVSVLMNLEDG